MNNPLVSILVPAYNIEKYIEQCVDSLLNQTYCNIEVIVVNDGSRDSTKTILENYEKDTRLRVISIENGGLSNARNVAIDAMRGEFFMFVDGDDWLDTKTIEICVDKALATISDIVMFSYLRENIDKSIPRKLFSEAKVFEFDESRKLSRRLVAPIEQELSTPEKLDSYGTAWGKLYRTNIIDKSKNRFVDLKKIGAAEDGLFNIAVFQNAKRIVYVDTIFYHYRKEFSTSLTAKNKANLLQQFYTLFDLIESEIPQNDADYKTALNNRIALSVVGLGLNELLAKVSMVKKVKKIRLILREQKIKSALKQLQLKYMPLHWKIFYLCARYKFAFLLYVQLSAIEKIRTR